MNGEDDECIELNTVFTKKRKSNPKNWQKNKAKEKRHNGEGK